MSGAQALHRGREHNASLCRTVPHCTALHCTAVYHTAPHCTGLYRTAPHCTTLYHTVLHCITLYHTLPHRTALYRTAPQWGRGPNHSSLRCGVEAPDSLPCSEPCTLPGLACCALL